MAGLFGALFGIVLHRVLRLTTDFGLPVYIGLIYGMWLWVVNGLVLLPALYPALTGMYASSLMVQHMVYGAITGLL